MIFPPIEDILPHRGSMLLVDRIVQFEPDRITVCAQARADAWYADPQGRMPMWIGIEWMAQAIAAHVGLSALQRGEPVRQGVLLGTRSYRCTVPAFPASEPLEVQAHRTLLDASGLGAYSCSIHQAGVSLPLASATLKVYQPSDFQTFLQQGSNI